MRRPQRQRFENHDYLEEPIERQEYWQMPMSYNPYVKTQDSEFTSGILQRQSTRRNPEVKKREMPVPHVAVSNSAHAALYKEVLDDMLSNFSSLYNDEDTADLCCSLNQEKVYVHKQFIKLYSEPLLKKIQKENQITKIEK